MKNKIIFVILLTALIWSGCTHMPGQPPLATAAKISETVTPQVPADFTSTPTKTKVTATPSPTPTSPATATATVDANDPPSANGDKPGPGQPDPISKPRLPSLKRTLSPADCQERFFEKQCTWFVAGKRPDVCQWLTPGMGNAYQWPDQARLNGGDLGIHVETEPHVGDIAAWPAGCDKASPNPPDGKPCTVGASGNFEGCGHVAYVSWVSADFKTIKVEEINWPVARPNQLIDVIGCMSFISSPKTAATPAGK